MTESIKKVAERLRDMDARTVGVTASGGYGKHKADAFLEDLCRVAEHVAGPKGDGPRWPFNRGNAA